MYAQTRSQKDKPIAVDVAKAALDSLIPSLEYVGTTKPIQTISLRSQVQGRLLNLTVEIGDRVMRGEKIGKLDDSLLVANFNQEQAKLATLQSELAQAKAKISNARIKLEEAKVNLEQTKNDAARYSQLAKQGAISRQSAESWETRQKVAIKAVQSAITQIETEKQGLTAILGEIAAQKAVIVQAQERLSYSFVVSPITGVILEKKREPGDLVNSGEEILTIGNLKQIKVIVPISELDLERVQVGGKVTVNLDSFSHQNFTGRVVRISPLADNVTRQIPVEIEIDNPTGVLNSGLLAKVTFSNTESLKIIIPRSAIF
ncbi:MAG: efflux RND transporter periplasmic adaptor subunit, partial [Cyanobacteria bacterium J083]